MPVKCGVPRTAHLHFQNPGYTGNTSLLFILGCRALSCWSCAAPTHEQQICMAHVAFVTFVHSPSALNEPRAGDKGSAEENSTWEPGMLLAAPDIVIALDEKGQRERERDRGQMPHPTRAAAWCLRLESGTCLTQLLFFCMPQELDLCEREQNGMSKKIKQRIKE